MPRSRRRHHSRSRSRSRSHSHERDREPKRRKIDIYESPHHKRSVSSEPEVSENENQNLDETLPELNNSEVNDLSNIQFNSTQNIDTIKSDNVETKKEFENSESEESDKNNGEKVVPDKPTCIDLTSESPDTSQSDTPSKAKGKALKITPNKLMSPQQIQKKLDSEKKRIDRQKEKEEREKKRLEEKEERERLKEEKLKQKQDKEQQRLKEKIEKQKEKELKEELKKKEKEEREQKRREKEEKEEQKRKEKEQEKIKRQLEIEEKNKEKQKIEERKQKAAAVFVNFFVPKKCDSIEDKKVDDINSSTFMPFEVKSDMRLAPLCRKTFTNDDKNHLDKSLKYQNCDTRPYLRELKQGYKIGKSGKTFPHLEDNNDDDDVMVIEDGGLGETIEDQKSKIEKMRAKFLKFHENQRPPYFGTWRKKSKYVRPKKPFGVDKDVFNYEIDSDDEWEEEGEGESLKGTDDEEDKENEPDEYEVDNEFFVPHCHLSDDEVDDEVNAKLSPESHKAKLRLLRNEFDEEMKSKTQKIKPRVLGCIWYDKTKSKVEEAIDRYLQPFAIICNGRINIPKRSDILTSHRKVPKQLGREHIPLFLRMIHGNVTKRKNLVEQFLEYMKDSGNQIDVSKLSLGRQFKQYADWMKCPDEGPMHNKFCWYVSENIRKEFNVDLQLPNKWVIISSKQDLV